MHIQLNGKPYPTQAGTIAALVAELALNTRQTAIERNREIVPRSFYATTMLQDGDEVEMVQFVGGG